MDSQQIKFGETNVDKKEFYSSKHVVFLDAVDLNKIVVSNRWKINNTTCKYYCGYLNNEIIRRLCVIMPQMDGYIKYFDDGAKNMSFVSDDEKVYLKYNKIWDMIKKLLKVKFTVNLVSDDKYVCCKLKIFNGTNKTTFTDDVVPLEKNRYVCIPAIDIDSVLKVNKKVYPQAYLEQCKYKLKKMKPVDFIDFEIIDESDDESD